MNPLVHFHVPVQIFVYLSCVDVLYIFFKLTSVEHLCP